MTIREAIEFIGEAEDAINKAMRSEDIEDVKTFAEDALNPLEKATEALNNVADDFDSAIFLIKPNTKV